MIFMESNETIGILYDSYVPLLEITKQFLGEMEIAIADLRNDPEDVDISDISDEIQAYKQKMQTQLVPAEIIPSQIRKTMKKLKDFQTDLNQVLERFAKDKDKIAFGGNYFRAVIQKPKVMTNSIDGSRQAVINEAIRYVSLGMDWIEKYLIDLFNLNDQDLNIVEIVNRVYLKQKIYESTGGTLYRISKNGMNIYEAYADSCSPKEYLRFTEKLGSWLPSWKDGEIYFTQEGYERFFESVWPTMKGRLGDCIILECHTSSDASVLDADRYHVVLEVPNAT